MSDGDENLAKQDEQPAKRRRDSTDKSAPDEWRSTVTQTGRDAIIKSDTGQWRGSIMNRVGPVTASDSVMGFAEPSRESYRREYVVDAMHGVQVARKAYRKLFRIYWSLRAIAITAGISVAAVATTPAPKWILGLLGALAAGAETIIAAGNLEERAVVSGLLADRIAAELRDYKLRFGAYSEGDSLETLHFRIEKIRNEASTARFRIDRSAGNVQDPDPRAPDTKRPHGQPD